MRNTQISIPTLVRIKRGALDRIGIYLKRSQFDKVVLVHSNQLDQSIVDRFNASMKESGVEVMQRLEVRSSSFEHALQIFQALPSGTRAIIGLGGGKALDVAKYASFLSKTPYIALPTALSNDGFSSPQSSLEIEGKRRSFPASMPYGVVIDTEVCLHAPQILWWSGVGDLVAKITAVYDWKLSFKIKGTQVDDFSALLSDATVFQFIARPERDLDGIRLLGTALMLNGIAMEICGSSRPASGSEHLISHALDLISKRPRMHGLQVGIATYIISRLQGQGTDRIAELFDATNFWRAIADDPFERKEWIEAFKMAPLVKSDFYTILSEKDWMKEFIQILDTDPLLGGLFV